jgi:hypothetical protein
MSSLQKIALCCFSFLFSFLYLPAQQGPAATGGDAAGAGGKVSYSIGQTDYISSSGTAGTVNPGLQQPYEILVVTGIERTDITLGFTVYPNPSSDFIILGVPNTEFNTWNYELFDARGELVGSQKIKDSENRISLVGLPNGVYLLRISGNDKLVKSFRIIKNQ